MLLANNRLYSLGSIAANPPGATSAALRPMVSGRASFTVTSATTAGERTDLAIVFTAPPSGVVAVTVGGFVRSSSGNGTAFISYRLRTGGTVGDGAMVADRPVGSAFGNYQTNFVSSSVRTLITDLTPGATYNVVLTYDCAATGIVTSSVGLTLEPCL